MQKTSDKEQFKKLNRKDNVVINEKRKKVLKVLNEIDNLSRPSYQRL
jgi:hypothetical protein